MRRTGAFALGLAIAVGGAGAYFGYDGSAQSVAPALAILSPPGAGYDATNVALTTASGNAVTVTRTGTQYCERVSGSLTSIAANKPCVDYAGALLVEPGATNSLLQSEDFTSASWPVFNTPVVTANTWNFGTGSATGETINDDNAAGSECVTQSVSTTTTGAWTGSVYAQAGTDTAFRMEINVTGGTGSSTCTFTGLAAATERKTCTITAGAGVTAVSMNICPNSAAGGTGSIKVGGAQLETGSVATSYIPTTAAAASRGAQTTTVANPLAASDTRFCLSATTGQRWTSIATSRGLMNVGTGFGAANTAGLFVQSSNAGVQFAVFDSTAGRKDWSATTAIAANTKITACYDAGGVTIYTNGIARTATTSGAGTGIFAPSAADLTVGALDSSGTFPAYESVHSFCIARGVGCR